MQALYQDEHPALQQQLQRVRAMQLTSPRRSDGGAKVDDQDMVRALSLLRLEVEADVALARQQLTDAHPRLALLELRLQVVERMIARR